MPRRKSPAKKKRAAIKAQVTSPDVPLVINPFGPTESRPIVKSKVAESVFTLKDGTKLKIRPIIGDVRRAMDQFNQQGDPLYLLTIGHQVKTDAPPRLRKKAAVAIAKKRRR